MSTAQLEHINITVSDPDRTAAMLTDLFGWHVRWAGPSMNDGRTVHVGTDTGYVALYSNPNVAQALSDDGDRAKERAAALNHVAVTVEDLGEVERRVAAAGLKPENHADYEPGRRFYFFDADHIEYEVVSYS
ncbi:MAG: VOC family protein [Pseudomonadota bacterium]